LVALIVKLYDATVVGVPVIAPVDVLSERPAGKEPDWTAKVIGVEPLAVTVVETANARYTVPKEVRVIVGATPVTDPVNAWSSYPAAFVALIVKVYAPTALGVPEITPDDVFKDSPVGNDPEFKAYVTGADPEAESVNENAVPATTDPRVVVLIVGPIADPTVPVNCVVLLPNGLRALTVKL
jgi:hypothetical protein